LATLPALVSDDSTQNIVSDTISLVQHQTLGLTDCEHILISDNVVSTLALIISDGLLLQTSDSLNITQGFVLEISNATQDQTSETPVVVYSARLYILLKSYLNTSINNISYIDSTMSEKSYLNTSINNISYIKDTDNEKLYMTSTMEKISYV